MARPANVPAVTPRQAQYILEKLIDERSVTAADIRRHLAGMWQEMSALEKRIAELRGLAGNVQPVRGVKRIAKRIRRASAEVLASRKLQGQYIAAIRQIPKNQRKHFATIAKKDGREAAIAAIKRHLGQVS
jgi:hypothetical protein